jgi:hypothetical protein
MFQLRLGAGGVILWTEVKGRVLNPADRNGRWCSGPSSAGTGFTTKSCSCCPAGATVALSGGRIVELEPRDMAFFSRGEESVWTIHETLRKSFHADSADPMPF